MNRNARSRSTWKALGHRAGVSLAQSLGALLAVIVVTFLMVRLLPGDAATSILGQRATPQSLQHLRAELHLNSGLLNQFWLYFSGLLHGELGHSLVQQGKPVLSIISNTLPTTLSVVAGALIISIVVGVPIGLLAGLTRHREIDVGIRGLAVILLATPTFLVSLLLLLVLALVVPVFPPGGWAGSWPGNFTYIVLPSLAMAAFLCPLIIRTVRQSAIQVSAEDFVAVAIGRGLKRSKVTRRHVLPNSLLPVVSLVGINIGALITGAVIVESIFGIPGIGDALVRAVSRRDYPAIQGIALVAAVFVILGNLVADVLYAYVDPRTR